MLNHNQKIFANEYLIDFNATQAAIRAGYSPKTAYSQGQRLLKHVEIKEYIKKRDEEITAELKLSQSRTFREIQKLAFFDARKFYREDGSLKSPCELDDTEAAALAGTETVRHSAGRDEDGKPIFETVDKIKYSDRKSALELLARVQGMLVDKSEVDINDVTGIIRLPAKKPVGAPVDEIETE